MPRPSSVLRLVVTKRTTHPKLVYPILAPRKHPQIWCLFDKQEHFASKPNDSSWSLCLRTDFNTCMILVCTSRSRCPLKGFCRCLETQKTAWRIQALKRASVIASVIASSALITSPESLSTGYKKECNLVTSAISNLLRQRPFLLRLCLV